MLQALDVCPAIIYRCKPVLPYELTYINQRAADLLGFPLERFLEDPSFWMSRVHPDDRKMVRHEFRKLVRIGGGQYTYRFLLPDGSVRWFRDRVQPAYDEAGNLIDIIGFETDITDQKTSDQALQNERDLLDSVFRSTLAAVVVLNPEGSIILANERAEAVLGLRLDDIHGRSYNAPSWQISNLQGQPIPDDQLPFAKVLASRKPVHDFRHAIRLPNGKKKILRINGEPLLDNAGEVTRVVFMVEDITDQHEGELALQREHQLVQTVVRSSVAAVLISDRNQRIIFANQRAIELAGLARDADGVYRYIVEPKVYDWEGNAIPPEKRAMTTTIKMRVALQNEQRVLDFGHGQRRTVSLNAEPVFNSAGEVEQVVIGLEDLTDHKLAQEAVRRSRARYRAIVQSQTDWVCRFTSDTTFTFANDPFSAAFQSSSGQIVGRRWLDLVPRHRRQELFQRILQMQKHPADTTWESKESLDDGTTSWFHWVCRPIVNEHGDIEEFQAVGRDITEQREAQEALRASQERFDLAVSGSSGGVWDYDLKTGSMYLSPQFYSLLGYPHEGFTSTHEAVLGMIHPADVDRVNLARTNHLEKQVPFDLVMRYRTRNGEYKWFRATGQAQWEDGEPVRMAGSLFDVHDQEISQEALRVSREHYRQLAKHHQRLLTEVNHRVRNNLSSLLSMIRMTHRDHKDSSFADRLSQRVRGMSRIHSLLSECGWRDIPLESMLNSLVAAGIDHQFPGRVTLQGPSVLLTPRIATPFAMSMIELLNNSIKYGSMSTPQGRLDINWQRHQMRSSHSFELNWIESGGPVVHPPAKVSLGTELVEGFLRYELGGQCEFDYQPEGLRVHIALPLPADVFEDAPHTEGS